MDRSRSAEQAGTASAARTSATVAGWTLVSRLTGFARVVVIGAMLGPTYFANMFVSTNLMPNLMFDAVAGPVVAMVVVPALSRALTNRGLADSARLFGRISGYLLATSGVIAGLLIVASPALATILTLGVGDGRARAHQITTVLLCFVAPQVVLYTMAAAAAAAQQARGRFWLPVAAPALENLGLIATMVLVASLFETGLEVDQVPISLVITLGLGSTLAVALHTTAQLIGASAVGLPVRPSLRWRDDPEAREVAARFRRSVTVTAFPSVSYFLLIAVAATVPGGVLVLQMAWLFYHLPVALGARAVSAAVLPGLATAAALDDASRYASSWRRALFLVTAAGLPALCLLVAFARPIADVLANGELRSGPLITAVASCIVVLGVAQLVGGVHEVGRQTLFARIDVRGPRLASAVSLAVVVLIGGACALLLPAGTPRLVGLCVAMLVGDVAAGAIVLCRLRAAIRPEPVVDARLLGATAIAAVAMLPVVAAGSVLVSNVGSSRLADLAIVMSLSTMALAVFALTLRTICGRHRRTP